MYFDDLSFRYEFRDYQQNVLNSLEEKLSDNKINVVAAPGSGKTVLGLELVRRIDKPCLILVPSISIREQWIDRFLQLFVRDEDRKLWEDRISIDLQQPKDITCITYQSLHAAYSVENFGSILKNLKRVGCVVLDESHHLKREWWKALESTISELNNPTIVSLTATPPYDADRMEWSRYNALCGDIDCEVLTPEMVKKHTLCPYQDHVYLTVPTQNEIDSYEEQVVAADKNKEALLKGEILYKLVRNYDALISPWNRTEIFMEEPYYLNALISYVRNYGMESAYFYEDNTRAADEIIAKWDSRLLAVAKESKMQTMSVKYFEILLDCIINKDVEHFEAEGVELLTDELKRAHLFTKDKLHISNHKEDIDKIIRDSASKMSAIKDIVCLEAKTLGDQLQMVILTDNIGRENLSLIGTGEVSYKMNCVSIFEMLRRMEHLNNIDAYMKSYESYIAELAGTRLGLLCGSFAILPKDALEVLNSTGKPIGNTSYYLIEITDSDRREIVARVTRAMSLGKINVLIGTVSLLGEGWDAVGVNAVVLGSNISSFVMTNQMRGRGLRLDSNQPDKTTNIWHIATLQPCDGGYKASDEYKNLVKRFDTILGIDNRGTSICSGVERIGLTADMEIFSSDFLDKYIEAVKSYASRRELIKEQWQHLMKYKSDFGRIRDVATLDSKSMFSWKKYDGRLNTKVIKSLANGLHNNMKRNSIVGSESVLRIESARGKVCVYLENSTPKENRLFINYYNQLNSDIIAPRYILCKGIGLWKQYFAIPDYCKNMEAANQLASDIGFAKSEIIYTRSGEGVKTLFEIRIHNLNMDRSTISKIRQIVIER